ncbi:DUF2750 domain-containing protein [Massilia sp. 9096]|uniref:DUF2750 domain-containing protein n=1 Tax=Massilia sp. 9096 TaxID=1500894 RepID=UPI00068BD2D9|nr:DUF2750 domain-containing protein [Massilia sp. 9096]
MTIDTKHVQAIVMLPGPQRYEYFVKRVVESGVVWSLFRQGWALAKKEDGALVFPLWPEREFAAICADYEWSGYAPQSFALEELIDELLPQLEQDGIATGVFYTPGARDVMPTAGLLLRDLRDEQRRASSPSNDQDGPA